MFLQIIYDWIVEGQDSDGNKWAYYVEEEDLETFCKILRKNGWTEYHIVQNNVHGATGNNNPRNQTISDT
jgi:hypothetical protein